MGTAIQGQKKEKKGKGKKEEETEKKTTEKGLNPGQQKKRREAQSKMSLFLIFFVRWLWVKLRLNK